MAKNLEKEQNNSFYKYGDVDMLSIEQDEVSHLWKIKLMTPTNYVVSREFDRTKGMYANASDEMIRIGLMEFSTSLLGEELAIYFVIDRFIDRCFSDDVFNKYTENAIWLSLEYPSYIQVENILNDYSCRLIFFDENSYEYSIYHDFIFKYKSNTEEFKNLLKDKKFKIGYMNSDSKVESQLKSKLYDDFVVFKSTYKNDEFNGFSIIRH